MAFRVGASTAGCRTQRGGGPFTTGTLLPAQGCAASQAGQHPPSHDKQDRRAEHDQCRAQLRGAARIPGSRKLFRFSRPHIVNDHTTSSLAPEEPVSWRLENGATGDLKTVLLGVGSAGTITISDGTVTAQYHTQIGLSSPAMVRLPWAPGEYPTRHSVPNTRRSRQCREVGTDEYRQNAW